MKNPVKFQPLARRDLYSLIALAIGEFLDGECYAFAIALHQGLGWPMIGLMGEMGGKRTIRHALVRMPTGKLMDVRRMFEPSDELLGEPFGLILPYELRKIRERDLFAIRPIDAGAVHRALWMAQAIWPTFPWKSGPLPQYHAFLKDLHALCRKHDVSMFAPFETAWPILTAAHGDERFIFSPSITGPNYIFNRKLGD